MTAVKNPYREVVDWLATDDGKRWSLYRHVRPVTGEGQYSPVAYQDDDDCLVIAPGFFSVKDDDHTNSLAVMNFDEGGDICL